MLSVCHHMWFQFKDWSMEHAIRLIAECEIFSRAISDPKDFTNQLDDMIELYRKWANDDIFKGKLELVARVDDPEYIFYEGGVPVGVGISFKYSYVAVSTFLEWAKNKGLKVPDPTSPDVVIRSDTESKQDVGKLTAEERREYGQLKLQKENMGLTVKAAVESTLFIESLPVGADISQDAFAGWLHDNGFGSITLRQIEQIWQALPSKNKKSAGKSKK